MFSSPSSKTEIRKIREILLRVMKQYALQLSAFSVENLTIHIIIALRRWMLFDYVRIEKSVEEKIKNTVEEVADRQLMRELTDEFSIVLPESEAVYFALHLKSKLINVKSGGWDSPKEKAKLVNTLEEIFIEINNRYGFDFRGDVTIQNYLIAHIRTMLERLEIGFPLRSSQPHEPKREYLMATLLTQTATSIIKKNYGVAVDDNEEGFLVLYFNLALYRMNMKHGLRIAVTNGSGRPEGIILLNKITQARKGIPDTITFIDVTELEELDENDYDIIVSSTELPQIKSLPVLLLGGHTVFDTEKLQKVIDLSRLGKIDYASVFPPEFLYPSIMGTTCEAVLAEIGKRLALEGDAEAADYVGGARLIELGKDGAMLSYPAAKILSKMKGREKLILITDALALQGMPPGVFFTSGYNTEVREDGSCVEVGSGMYIGSTLGMNSIVEIAVEKCGIEMAGAVDASSCNPAALLGIENQKGRLYPGYDTDIVVLNDDYSVVQTFCKGLAQL